MSRPPTRFERDAAFAAWSLGRPTRDHGGIAQRWSDSGIAWDGSCLPYIAQAIADAYDRGIADERRRAAAEHGDAIARHLEGADLGGVGSINPKMER